MCAIFLYNITFLTLSHYVLSGKSFMLGKMLCKFLSSKDKSLYINMPITILFMIVFCCVCLCSFEWTVIVCIFAFSSEIGSCSFLLGVVTYDYNSLLWSIKQYLIDLYTYIYEWKLWIKLLLSVLFVQWQPYGKYSSTSLFCLNIFNNSG